MPQKAYKSRVDPKKLEAARGKPAEPSRSAKENTSLCSLVRQSRSDPGNMSTRDILALQSSLGNKNVLRLLASRANPSPTLPDFEAGGYEGLHNKTAEGGLQPGADPEEDVLLGGPQTEEILGDIARPVGTALGEVVGSVAAAVTGISISSTTNVGPTWSDHGRFNWQVGFTTTGKSGWIVQEITNTYRAEDKSGKSVAPVYTPHYWEAWAVDSTSKITPSVGTDNDYWRRPSRGAHTQGHWSMTGSVYFTTTDPATQGFTASGVKDAGILLSSTSAPGDLGIARLHRYAQGTWDSTGAAPSHTGSAGP
jgi:hypothetical protein